MGVPKFYRWVSERYPCLSETVKEFQIPEFDNLYLDMNGIIHVCSHPEDDNPHFRITEEQIFKDISHYLEFLFRMIKPRKVFFMAVDGVAPRAKMNQQRGRRFRSSREAEELEKKAKDSGEILPTEKRFDSNCITPGTEFMVKLHEHLKYFVTTKISTDPLWHGVDVYLSGHETPGEGEHKIMDFIRHEKAKPDYDPNTRHCLHGLDADLMMLGLATHEPHFSLLREEVRFGGKKDKGKRPATPEETTFHLLHLSLFREYLDFEFAALKNKLPFDYSLENIIDDWILMGFLVGNDFIPHLPHLHIHHDALPLLWRTYITVLPDCEGYMNESGHLNLERFEKFMKELAKYDVDKFSEMYTDLKWFEGKQLEKKETEQKAKKRLAKRANRKNNQFLLLTDLKDDDDIGDEYLPTSSPGNENVESNHVGSDNGNLENAGSDNESPENTGSDDASPIDDDDDSDTFDEEFRLHKRNYYMTKLEYENVDKKVLQDQSQGYIRALQWILLYYFEGVPSWSWFYPHHYAPFISDVTEFKDMKIEFDLGKPFLPFQQLMAVLPSASKALLPEPYQKLMTMDISPVIDFYPVQFNTDLNGKLQQWEAVVLIPFIDEKRLLDAMSSVEKELSPSEKRRNRHGPCLMYKYSAEKLETYASPMPGSFPDVIHNHARMIEKGIDAFTVEKCKLRKGLLPEVRLDVHFPGFPTLKHIPHTAYLKKEGVKVFQLNSRNENMMLQIAQKSEEEIETETVANQLLGKSTFVGWPHLYEAKVVAVLDDTERYSLAESLQQKGHKHSKNKQMEIKKERLSEVESEVWHREVHSITERYKDRLGVVVGSTSILIKAVTMTGRTYVCGSHGAITLEKQFGQNPVPFVYQATVKDISVHDPSFCQYKTLSELFAVGDVAFMLGWPHYGCQGEVLDVEKGENPRVRINVTTLEEPDLDKFTDTWKFSSRYYSSYVASQRIGVGSHFLSRITGSMYVKYGSPDDARDGNGANIGLNLKFTKRGEEIPGYTKMSRDGWTYSQKAIDTVIDYLQKYPDVWDHITNMEKNAKDMFFESDLFKDKSVTLKEMVEYVKSLPCSQIKPQKCGADVLDEGVIKEIEKETNKVNERNEKKIHVKKVKMQVKPYLLFKPVISHGAAVPDASVEYQIFDRVVNVRQGYAVPFGLRGTVVGVHKEEKESDTLYDVIFDKDFQGGISVRGSSERGYRMPSTAMINLTYGARKNGAANVSRTNGPVPETTVAQHSNPLRHPQQSRQFDNSSSQQQYQTQHRNSMQSKAFENPNFSRGFNNYNESSQRGQGSYSEFRNRNDTKNAYNNNNQNDNWGYRYNDNYGGYDNHGQKQRTNSYDNQSWRGEMRENNHFWRDENRERNQSWRGDNREYNQSWRGDNRENNQSWRGDNRENNQSWRDDNREYNQSWRGDNRENNQSWRGDNRGKNQAWRSEDRFSERGSYSGSSPRGLPDNSRDTRQEQKEENKRENQLKQSQGNINHPQNLSLRQQSFDGSENNPPTFVTPKISPGRPQTRRDSGQSKIFHEVQSNEFANMWKELQSSGKPDKDLTPGNESDKMTTQNQTETKTSNSTDPKPASVTLETLFNQAKTVAPEVSQIKAAPDGGEKPNLSDSAVEESTAALKQMLKIGSASDEIPKDTKQDKTYGRQVSVQELFDGAKQLPPTAQIAPGQVTEDHGNKLPKQQQKQQPLKQQQQNISQQHRQGQRNQAQPGQYYGNRRNPVVDLARWCHSLGKPEPKYDIIGQPGSYSCIVTLPDGARFQGSVTRTQEEATENAAAVTLLQISGFQRSFNHPLMSLPGFRQISSPNSAFKPVSPVMPQRLNTPPNFRPQRQYAPPHGHYYNPQQHGHFRQQATNQQSPNKQYLSNQYHQQKPGRKPSFEAGNEGQKRYGSENQKSGHQLDAQANPFVPLQVTKQQKTPSKRKDSDTHDTGIEENKDKTETPTVAKNVLQLGEVIIPKADTCNVKPHIEALKQTPVESNVDQTNFVAQSNSEAGRTPIKNLPETNSHEGQNKSKNQGSQPKRRTRIAANFNFTNS